MKEYEFNTHPRDEVELVFVSTMRRVSDGALMNNAEVVPIGDNIYRPLLSGFREGDDARDVLSEAIDWWEAQLATIEHS